MSGNTVPSTNIYLKTAPNSAGTAIFEVFGTPAGNNLRGLEGYSNLDPGPKVPSSGTNIALTTFANQRVLIPPTGVTLTNCTTTGGTVSWTKPTLSTSGNSTLCNYTVTVGTTSGGIDICSNTIALNGTTQTLAFTKTLAPNTTYYVGVSTNLSNGCASAPGSIAQAFPAAATSLLLSFLGGPQSFIPSWTAPAATTPANSLTTTTITNKTGTVLTSTVVNGATCNTLNLSANSVYGLNIQYTNSVGSMPIASATFISSIPGAFPTQPSVSTATTTSITPLFTPPPGDADMTYLGMIGTGALIGSNALSGNGSVSITNNTPVSFTGTTSVSNNTLIYFKALAQNAKGTQQNGVFSTPVSYPSSLPDAMTLTSLSATSSNFLLTFVIPVGNATLNYLLLAGTTSGGTDLANNVQISPSSTTPGATVNYVYSTNAPGSNNNVHATVSANNARGCNYATRLSDVSTVPPLTLTGFTLTNPSLPSASVTFTTTGNATTTCTLRIGNTSGGSNVYNGSYTSGTTVTLPVQNLNLYATIVLSNSKGSTQLTSGPSNYAYPMTPTNIYSTYSGGQNYVIYWTDPTEAYGTTLVNYWNVSSNGNSYPGIAYSSGTARSLSISGVYYNTLTDGTPLLEVNAINPISSRFATGTGMIPFNNFYRIASIGGTSHKGTETSTYCQVVADNNQGISMCVDLAYPTRTSIKVITNVTGGQANVYAYTYSNGYQANLNGYFWASSSFTGNSGGTTLTLPASFSNALSIWITWAQSYPGNWIAVSYN